MSHTERFTDGIMEREIIFDGDQVHGLLTQNKQSRQLILERNLRLRNEPGALNHMGFMGLELTIPQEDYYNLLKKYPDLNSRDSLTHSLAWKKFMGSAESVPYRVRAR